jgi:hypothetical protein
MAQPLHLQLNVGSLKHLLDLSVLLSRQWLQLSDRSVN